MYARIIVLGGGLSGLTTAYELAKHDPDVLVLEAGQVAGGCIKTDRKQGYLVEHGPNSMLVNRQQVLNFIQELGLGDNLQEADAKANNRFIVKNRKLHALPTSALSFVGTSLFSMGDKFRLFKEPFIKRGPKDESVADFVRRRLGNGFYDYAINPFVSGVYAGDPDKLLARAAIKKVWVLEEKHGSLIGGALAMITGRDKPEGRIKGRLLSFKDGMRSLPLALAEKLGDKIRTGVRADRIEQQDGGWAVLTEQGRFTCDHLVLATPADVTADLLAPFSTEAATALRAIPYAPVAVAHFGFKRRAITHSLNGFGCLIPRKEQISTLGMLFSSTLFPGRLPEDDLALLTCFIGGATCNEIRDWSDEQVSERVLADLRAVVGIEGDPCFANFVRWSRAIPQYTFGHFERIQVVAETLTGLGNISARANWKDGISVPDCILNAVTHARDLK